MKKVFALTAVLVLLSNTCEAQYNVNKTMCDYRTYSYQEGYPYKPSAMCFVSMVIPGLGQILEGEGGGGFLFLVPSVTLTIINWRLMEGQSGLILIINSGLWILASGCSKGGQSEQPCFQRQI